MSKNNISQIDLMAAFFADETSEQNSEVNNTETNTGETNKPVADFGASKKQIAEGDSCSAEITCEGDRETDDDTDDTQETDFAAIEQQLGDASGTFNGGKNAVAKKGSAGKKQTKVQPEKKFEELDARWVVCYAGQTEIVEKKGLKLEDIRKSLLRKYPELSKAEMAYDVNQKIMVQGQEYSVIRAIPLGKARGSK